MVGAEFGQDAGQRRSVEVPAGGDVEIRPKGVTRGLLNLRRPPVKEMRCSMRHMFNGRVRRDDRG